MEFDKSTERPKDHTVRLRRMAKMRFKLSNAYPLRISGKAYLRNYIEKQQRIYPKHLVHTIAKLLRRGDFIIPLETVWGKGSLEAR